MKVVIASGKGGTGKTTVAVNLAKVIAPVHLVDCDVEAPNAHLFLPHRQVLQQEITVPVPEVIDNLCTGCRACSAFCQYHAIVVLEKQPMIFNELCHSCGGCIKICPERALKESPRRIGELQIAEADGITLVQGKLDIGVAMASPLIRAVKAVAHDRSPVILDAPPGTACPVVTTISGTDAVVLVTEPTPFGLNDLKLAVEMVRDVQIPFGVVINRVGIGDERVDHYCKTEEIPVLLEIPDDRRIAEAYSRGIPMIQAVPEYEELFRLLYRRINDMLEF